MIPADLHRERVGTLKEVVATKAVEGIGDRLAVPIPTDADRAIVGRVGNRLSLGVFQVRSDRQAVSGIERQGGIPNEYDHVSAVIADRVEIPPLVCARRRKVKEAIGIGRAHVWQSMIWKNDRALQTSRGIQARDDLKNHRDANGRDRTARPASVRVAERDDQGRRVLATLASDSPVSVRL